MIKQSGQELQIHSSLPDFFYIHRVMRNDANLKVIFYLAINIHEILFSVESGFNVIVLKLIRKENGCYMPLSIALKIYEHNSSVNKHTDTSPPHSTECRHNNSLNYNTNISNKPFYLCQKRLTTAPPDNSQNRIDKVKRVRSGALLSEMPQCENETTTIEVEMGEVRTVTDHQTVLYTTNLTDCSALVLLSNRGGSNYQTRTMMHLMGSNLNYGLTWSRALLNKSDLV
ncbi:hypothetical protein [Candidatus Symbiopectobacterium sp. 'North America']|uniref:hypothetical protein n=1 Tax=Candidatus Symbiopectobacterium sp. 'North America' TaxID=2794574 RepID=UPI0018C8F80D|nr:hypothetical protein [Candidatus Symbiopectobacterium sp. 'North America']